MHPRQLKTFAAVAETLSFTRAAEHVHLSQSSVTEQIQALEADLGAVLFDRSRRRLSLTPAGQRLLAYAAELMDLMAETRRAVAGVSGSVSGKLVIGGLETLCAARLPELLAEFHRRCPAVELALETAGSGSLRSGIRNGSLDVAFFFGSPPAASDAQCETVGEEGLRIILPTGHRLAGRPDIGLEDLLDEKFLVTPPGCVYRRMFDEAFAGTLPVRPERVGEFASIGVMRELVEKGVGCALVPRSAVPAESSCLVAVKWAGPHRTTPVTMMWRDRRANSAALAAFLASAREFLRGHTRR